jgi:hypothetical protein
MRKSILFFVLFLSLGCVVIAQEAISYQAIARSNTGSILSNQNISVKFEIRQGSLTGTSLFTETHAVTTNQFGLFTLSIGSVSTTQFQAINWANMPFFMEVSIDPAGGTSFASVGNQQLMSVPYALYAKTAGNAGITPTISINAPNSISSSAGSYSITVPASTTYSAGTGISISSGVITNTAVAPTPSITGTGATTVTSSGNTFTVSTPVAVVYTAGSGISVTSGTVTNTAPDKTVSIAAAGSATVSGAYPNFTVNVPNGTLLPNGRNGQFIYSNGTIWDTIPRAKLYFDGNNFGIGTQSPMSDFHVNGGGRFGASVTTVDIYTDNIKITGGTTGQVLTSDAAGNGSWQTPATAILTYTAGTNRLSVTQGTAVSTVTLTAGNVNGTGTAGVVPMWGGATTLTNSPINASTTTGGVIIAPSLAGSGSPAQSLQVQGPSSGSTYAAHFLQGTNPNTGIGISTQSSGGHAIGTLNNQDLGFFTNNTNVTGSYPLILKTNGRVGIGNVSPSYSLDVNGGINTSQFYNMNGLAAAPLTSNSGEGKLYFNSASNKLMMSENGGAWVPLANTLWTRGTGILYNTTQTDNVGIGTNIPANTLDVLSTAAVSALRSKNSGTGNGIEGGANSASSAGILGYNDGAGPGIAGSKSLSVPSGNAGLFQIFNSANASNALVASTPGNGAAVHAINTATGTTASNLSVLLDDGHFKARATTPITPADITIGANSLGTSYVTTNSYADQSNDVRGVITLNGSYILSSGYSDCTYLTVQFKKKYKNPPVILLTPSIPPGFADEVLVTAQLVNVANTDFTFRLSVYYEESGPVYTPSQFNVSYMIME